MSHTIAMQLIAILVILLIIGWVLNLLDDFLP